MHGLQAFLGKNKSHQHCQWVAGKSMKWALRKPASTLSFLGKVLHLSWGQDQVLKISTSLLYTRLWKD